jgi:putative FmdB family regulatory protein
MPVFEYQCVNCKTKFEIFHKSSSNPEEVACPRCGSKEYKKLLSAFSASIKASGHSHDICSSGNCGMADYGGCAGGMCGLN